MKINPTITPRTSNKTASIVEAWTAALSADAVDGPARSESAKAQLLKFCRQMQRQSGPGVEWGVSCRYLSDLFSRHDVDVEPKEVARWMQGLICEGWLRRVKEGALGEGTSRYVYLGPLPDVERFILLLEDGTRVTARAVCPDLYISFPAKLKMKGKAEDTIDGWYQRILAELEQRWGTVAVRTKVNHP